MLMADHNCKVLVVAAEEELRTHTREERTERSRGAEEVEVGNKLGVVEVVASRTVPVEAAGCREAPEEVAGSTADPSAVARSRRAPAVEAGPRTEADKVAAD